MFVNIWLILSDDTQTIILASLNEQGEYNGPLRPRSRRLFTYMQDHAARRQLFTKPRLQGTVYNLWSIEFDDDRDSLQLVRDEFDFLIDKYPDQISICGAWLWNGAQIGMPPLYPIPDYLWRFMPPWKDEGALTQAQPSSNTDLLDINLLMGQSPRDFS